jgi:hypothetical protein
LDSHTENICVAGSEAETFEEGREKKLWAFGSVFATSYQDSQWDEKDMKYFPRGYLEL